MERDVRNRRKGSNVGAKTISLKEVRSRWLENPEARRIYEESEPAYQLARLRIIRGLTQQELAELVGTHQPSIARMESGKGSPSVPFLRRVAEALGTTLSCRIGYAPEAVASSDVINRVITIPMLNRTRLDNEPVPEMSTGARGFLTVLPWGDTKRSGAAV